MDVPRVGSRGDALRPPPSHVEPLWWCGRARRLVPGVFGSCRRPWARFRRWYGLLKL